MKKLSFVFTFLSLITSFTTVFATHTPTHFEDPCVPKSGIVPFTDVGGLLGNLLSVAIIGGSILLFLYLIMGGVQWMTSGGDKVATQAARDRITAALVGLLIILAVWGVFRVLEAALGISVLGGIKIPSVPNQPFNPRGSGVPCP